MSEAHRHPQPTIPSNPMIQLEDVHLTLSGGGGQVNVLRGVSLSLPAGASASVVGPSGAGKTTLLMIISGLERPTRGRVVVAGNHLTDIREDDLARFRRRHVGVVFQSFHLIPTMSALENVAVPLEFAGVRSPLQQAWEALADVGLTHRAKHYPAQLSGGEQQRVALARAFVARPDLILADEPTGNLDRNTGEKVIELLFHLQRTSGTTLLLVTHDEHLASRCSRTLHMADGEFLPNHGGNDGRT